MAQTKNPIMKKRQLPKINAAKTELATLTAAAEAAQKAVDDH